MKTTKPLSKQLLDLFHHEFGSRKTNHVCSACGRKQSVGVRFAAKQIGVSPATASRLMRGFGMDVSTMDKLFERYRSNTGKKT